MLIQDLLASRLSRQALDALEVIMQKTGYVWQSEFARRHRAEGHAEGSADALRGALLKVLDRRGIVLSQPQHALVQACSEPDQLEQWVEIAATATTAEEVFGDTR